MMTYKIHLHKEPEGGYTVTVPSLPGCITYGENIDEALEMAKEAIELYLNITNHNEKISKDYRDYYHCFNRDLLDFNSNNAKQNRN